MAGSGREGKGMVRRAKRMEGVKQGERKLYEVSEGKNDMKGGFLQNKRQRKNPLLR